jgi:hypothetical protein
MINQTYPAEYTIYDADEDIINAIRDRIGDRLEFTRYYLPAAGSAIGNYVQDDDLTFYDSRKKFWPYHLKLGTLTCSGVTNPQVLGYKYLIFQSPIESLTASGIDFWVHTFKLSDYEIWSAYLSVDLTPLLKDPDCLSEEMEILKAAIDLIVAHRTDIEDLYTSKEVVDNDTRYRRDKATGVDPLKDLVDGLQQELDRLIDECNKRLLQDGYRLE